MLNLVKKLFPINRSITGEGNVKTLKILKEINSNLKIKSFKSGMKVYDWEIPLEWNVKKAYIQHSSGKKFAEFKKNNLHLASYSQPVNKKLSRVDLLKKIFTFKKNAKFIPYVTLYYTKDWGFCMSKIEKDKLPNGNYKVLIDSRFSKGNLHYGEYYIKGKVSKEIIFTTNICHPSMANNELSGPTVLTYLIKYLKKKKNYFSYRFLFLPETIGAIAYINKNLKKLKKNTFCGFVVSCVGDDKNFSLINSPEEDNIADISLKAALFKKKKRKFYSFKHRGSDERQFCSPLVNLPFAGFSRSKYGEYPEYHSSGDNLSLISDEGLKSSYELLKNLINAFEIGIYPKSKVFCEPQLSKRKLYPLVGTVKNRNQNRSKITLDLIAYSNGKKTIFEIAIILNVELKLILEIYETLIKEEVLTSIYL